MLIWGVKRGGGVKSLINLQSTKCDNQIEYYNNKKNEIVVKKKIVPNIKE